MKTKILLIVLVAFLVISVVPVTTAIAADDKAEEKAKGPDEKAKAPDLEKIEFIHWKKGFGRPTCNNNGVCEPELGENPSCGDCKNGDEDPTDPEATCYAFMGKYGKKYLKLRELPVTYRINPNNPYNLSAAFVAEAISGGAEEWDWFTETTELFNQCEIDPAGTAYKDQNYVNGISFGNYYSDSGIIAACTVWYNPATKTIVEFDIIFETDYTWGDAGETDEDNLGDTNVMDLQNIATHELGHALGLADVYEGCPEVTMYGYSMEGETKKRTLAEPDIIGILELYPDPAP